MFWVKWILTEKDTHGVEKSVLLSLIARVFYFSFSMYHHSSSSSCVYCLQVVMYTFFCVSCLHCVDPFWAVSQMKLDQSLVFRKGTDGFMKAGNDYNNVSKRYRKTLVSPPVNNAQHDWARHRLEKHDHVWRWSLSFPENTIRPNNEYPRSRNYYKNWFWHNRGLKTRKICAPAAFIHGAGWFHGFTKAIYSYYRITIHEPKSKLPLTLFNTSI